jgi:hypothetical protein
MGFSTSAFESLLIAAVGDIFFVHQRGVCIAFITFLLNAASSLVSIVCGHITTNIGWIWLFHILQIFTVFQFLLMFFFCPETTYIRDKAYDIDQVQEDKMEKLVETEHQRALAEQEPTSDGDDATPSTTRHLKKTYLQSLAVYTGTYEDANFIKLITGPFITLLNLATLWECVCSALLTMWYVTSGISQAAIFSAPPWNFDAAQIGNMSVGPFVGGIIGSAIVGITSDPLLKWCTKINKGI